MATTLLPPPRARQVKAEEIRIYTPEEETIAEAHGVYPPEGRTFPWTAPSEPVGLRAHLADHRFIYYLEAHGFPHG